MTGKHTIPTSKIALISLILLNFLFTFPRKHKNPAKIQNLPKIDKNSSFFVIFVRKTALFSCSCSFFYICEHRQERKIVRKTVIKTCVLYTDLRILARKLARLNFADKFYSGIHRQDKNFNIAAAGGL